MTKIHSKEFSTESTQDNVYLRMTRNIPLLTFEEELALGKRVQEGDMQARDHMILSNLRLVIRIAIHKLKKHPSHNLMDLIQEGNIGLMAAVDKYDPTFNCRFSTHGVRWIIQAIDKYITKMKRRSDQEIITEDAELIRLDTTHKSVGDPTYPDVLMNRHVKVYVDKLDPRPRTIINLSYGFDGEPSLNIAEVARICCISRSYCHRLLEGVLEGFGRNPVMYSCWRGGSVQDARRQLQRR